MPRAHIVSTSADAPLTVTAVSLRLGVAPSTLRTWERRYGLGPGERQAGAHRRYLPEDVARLSRMVDLIHKGVAASDAARIVLECRPGSHVDLPAAPSDPALIVRAAHEGDVPRLVTLIEAAVETNGLVHTWSDLLEPALDTILASDEGMDPGHAPTSVLTSATLTVLREISDHRPPTAGTLPGVLILKDQEHTLAAHVAGVALQWHGLAPRVLDTGWHGGQDGKDRTHAHLDSRDVRIVVVMGEGASCEKLITSLADRGDTHVLVTGAGAPAVLNHRVQKVRTLAACVEEVVALVGADVHS